MAKTSPNAKLGATELLVYAPLGAMSLARDFLPGFVAMCVSRGRSELADRQEQIEEQIARARSVGQMASVAGPSFLEKQLEEARARASEALAGLGNLGPRPAPEPEATPPSAPSGNGAARPAPVTATSSDEAAKLAIPDYDALAATQVVDRLAGLSRDELEAVRAYESAHRGRKTILGRIEQLRD